MGFFFNKKKKEEVKGTVKYKDGRVEKFRFTDSDDEFFEDDFDFDIPEIKVPNVPKISRSKLDKTIDVSDELKREFKGIRGLKNFSISVDSSTNINGKVTRRKGKYSK